MRLRTREANQVGAQAEARTLARRHGDRGREGVEQSERGERGNANRQDLAEVRLLGVQHQHGHERNHEALD